MAKKTATAPAPAAPETKSKARIIKEYHKAHPEAKPAEIAKALDAQGVKVSSGRVSNVLARSKPRIDVEQIKSAGRFLKSYKGKVEDAAAAIASVGDYIESCGSPLAALAALEAYQAVAEALDG